MHRAWGQVIGLSFIVVHDYHLDHSKFLACISTQMHHKEATSQWDAPSLKYR